MKDYTIDDPDLHFWDSEGYPYAGDPKTLHCFLVHPDGTLVPRPLILYTDLWHWATPMSKEEALKLAAELSEASKKDK